MSGGLVLDEALGRFGQGGVTAAFFEKGGGGEGEPAAWACVAPRSPAFPHAAPRNGPRWKTCG
jgi:hypothetical protein